MPRHPEAKPFRAGPDPDRGLPRKRKTGKRGVPAVPRIAINMAASLDGKTTSVSREPVAFTSREDRRRLVALRAWSDAVLVGAVTATVDRNQTLGVPDARLRHARLRRGQTEHPLRVIVSGRLSLSPTLPIFRNPLSPAIVACSMRASARRRKLFSKRVRLVVCGHREVDLKRLVALLAADYGVRRIVCEGGPTLNDALFRAGLVDEMFLTLLPRLVGGRDAPTLVDGIGFPRLKDAPRARLVSRHRGNREWFLRYRFRACLETRGDTRQAIFAESKAARQENPRSGL